MQGPLGSDGHAGNAGTPGPAVSHIYITYTLIFLVLIVILTIWHRTFRSEFCFIRYEFGLRCNVHTTSTV